MTLEKLDIFVVKRLADCSRARRGERVRTPKAFGVATETEMRLMRCLRSVEKQVSRPGHRLPACGADRHLACRFPCDTGQDARSPHSQDGCAPVTEEFFNKASWLLEVEV
jgi:hypothetical protein